MVERTQESAERRGQRRSGFIGQVSVSQLDAFDQSSTEERPPERIGPSADAARDRNRHRKLRRQLREDSDLALEAWNGDRAAREAEDQLAVDQPDGVVPPFGQLSQVAGRRKSMIAALGLSLVVIPFWAFGGSLAVLVTGSFLMQAGVQGAWGVIPVHLNELSADATRGLMPGLTYQLGFLLASPTNSMQYALRDRVGYQWAIAGFEIVTIVTLCILLLLGTERHSRSFVRDPLKPAPAAPE